MTVIANNGPSARNGNGHQKREAIQSRPAIQCRAGLTLNKKTIRDRIANLGNELDAEYAGTGVTLVAVLSGAMPFATDLLRRFEMTAVRLEFVKASSYNQTSRGELTLHEGLLDPTQVTGRVLVVDDIYDSGATITMVVEYLCSLGVKKSDIKVVTLLRKVGKADPTIPNRVEPDYVGFDIDGSLFVIGYGLDYEGKYRNLQHVTDYPQ